MLRARAGTRLSEIPYTDQETHKLKRSKAIWMCLRLYFRMPSLRHMGFMESMFHSDLTVGENTLAAVWTLRRSLKGCAACFSDFHGAPRSQVLCKLNTG